MTNITRIIASAAVAFSATAAAADTYIRPHKTGDQQITVAITDDALWCTRVSDGFEMCNGMTENEDGIWGGKNMRHPDMPKWMKFKGTVYFNDSGLKIKGLRGDHNLTRRRPAAHEFKRVRRLVQGDNVADMGLELALVVPLVKLLH